MLDQLVTEEMIAFTQRPGTSLSDFPGHGMNAGDRSGGDWFMTVFERA